MEIVLVGRIAVYEYLPKHGYTGNRNILFSHANGVAARTYDSFLQGLAEKLQCRVLSYDIRGMGDSSLAPGPAYAEGKKAIWSHLVDDLKRMFHALQKMFGDNPDFWALAGHSLGGWLSLFAATELKVTRLLLLDIPILSTRSSFLWTVACLTGKRERHPLGQVARRRKEILRNEGVAFEAFRKSAFFKNWPDEAVKKYIECNYRRDPVRERLILKHHRRWEADVFESMPANAASAFLKIPRTHRNKLQLFLLVGKKSKVCNVKAEPYVRMFFPRLRWQFVPLGGHMFPFEFEGATLATLNEVDFFSSEQEAL